MLHFEIMHITVFNVPQAGDDNVELSITTRHVQVFEKSKILLCIISHSDQIVIFKKLPNMLLAVPS